MLIIGSYIFSPGGPGQGTITVPIAIEQEKLGEIINVTRGSVLYRPDEGEAGASLQVGEGSTVITLEQTTTYCLPEDKLQIQYIADSGGGVSSDVTVVNTALNPIPVTTLTLPLPSGAATSAKQDTQIATFGATDVAAAGSDDGTFPFLAFVKRILQKLTTLGGYVDGLEGTATNIDGKLPSLDNGSIPISPVGISDPGNSTTSNLGISAVFTGTGIEASPKYGTISVCIFSSHSSAANGLKFQASIDNINWETTEEYSYIGGSGLQSYSFAPSGRYFRLTYTNGSTATTKLVIFTVLRSGYTKSSSHRISDTITGEKDAELVKAVLAAMKPNGDFVDIHATAGGNLKVSVEEVNGIDPLPTEVPSRTPTTTSVASSASSVTILASNANRKGFSISNISTAKLYLSFSNPATVANCFIEVPAGAFLLLDQQCIVASAIYGIWASANGTAQVTEYV